MSNMGIDYNSGAITLEVDGRPLETGLNQANKGFDNFEKKAGDALDSVRRKHESLGDVVVRISDRSRSSIDRTVESVQKLAAMYGKTGVNKLEAELGQLNKRLAGNDEAIRKVTESYRRMIAVQKSLDEATSAGGGGGHGGVSTLAFKGIKDLFEGRTSGALAESANILSKLGGAQAIFAGAAAGVSAFAIASIAAAKNTAEFAHEQEILSQKTGLSTTETQLFSRMAQMTGGDVNSLTTRIRTLAKSLSYSTDEGRKAKTALKELGLDQSIAFQSPGAALNTIYSRLNDVASPFDKERIASTLFGRGGLDELPMIGHLKELTTQINAAGAVMDEQGIRKASEYHHQLDLLGLSWDALKLKFGEKVIGVIDILAGGRSLGELAKDAGAGLLNVAGPLGNVASFGVNLYRHFGAPDSIGSLQGLNPEVFKSSVSNPYAIFEGQKADQIRSYLENGNGGGLAGRQSSLEMQLRNAQTDQSAAVDRNDLSGVRSAHQKVLELQEQLKALTQIASITERTATLQDEARLKPFGDEAGLMGKILATDRDFNQKIKDTPSQLKELNSLRQLELGALYQELAGVDRKNHDDRQILEQKFNDTLPKDRNEQYLGSSLKQLLKESGEGFAADDEVKRIGLDATRSTLQRQASQSLRLSELSDRSNDPMGAAANAYRTRIDLANQLSRIELGLIGEEEDANKQRIMEATRIKDLASETAEAQNEFTLKQAETLHQQFEQVQKTAEGLSHTLFTSPRSFPGQLRNTLRDLALKPAEQFIGNAVGHALVRDGSDEGKALFVHVVGMGPRGGVASTSYIGASGSGSPVFFGASGGTWGGDGASALPYSLGSPSSFGIPGPSWSGASDLSSSTFSPSGLGIPGDLFGGSGNPASIIGPGGTATFAHGGGVSGLGSGVNGVLRSITSGKGLAGLKDTWFNEDIYSGAGHANAASSLGLGGDFAGALTSKGAASLYTSIGVPLALAGLTGGRRGTWGGIGESTLGGTLTGAGIGTMIMPGIGTAIGAVAGAVGGFATGGLEKLFGVESPESEAKRLIRQMYHLNIQDRQASAIVQLANQSYGGRVSIAIRSPEGRQMLGLYAASTGQSFPQYGPRAGSLSEESGTLFQQQTYLYGKGSTLSSSLPVAGYGSGGGFGSGPSTVVLNVNGQSAADLLDGRVANTVNPSYVQSQYAQSQMQSMGRQQSSALINDPGLIVS